MSYKLMSPTQSESFTHGLIKYDSYIALLINKHSSYLKALGIHYLPIWIQIPLVSRFYTNPKTKNPSDM